MPDTHTYAVTYYGRHNIRFVKQIVTNVTSFVEALAHTVPPPGSVRVWVGLVPTPTSTPVVSKRE